MENICISKRALEAHFRRSAVNGNGKRATVLCEDEKHCRALPCRALYIKSLSDCWCWYVAYILLFRSSQTRRWFTGGFYYPGRGLQHQAHLHRFWRAGLLQSCTWCSTELYLARRESVHIAALSYPLCHETRAPPNNHTVLSNVTREYPTLAVAIAESASPSTVTVSFYECRYDSQIVMQQRCGLRVYT